MYFEVAQRSDRARPARNPPRTGIEIGSKGVLTTLKIMPLPEAVSIPFFSQHLKDGVFDPSDAQAKAVTDMLDELLRWTNALKTLRG
ncbi:MAG TPA: hypothetical protein VF331_02750 [Polyangiales bacterium]